jgi:hypothetical protein
MSGLGRKAEWLLWRPHPRKPTTGRVSQMHQCFASLEPSVSCCFCADAKSVSFASRARNGQRAVAKIGSAQSGTLGTLTASPDAFSIFRWIPHQNSAGGKLTAPTRPNLMWKWPLTTWKRSSVHYCMISRLRSMQHGMRFRPAYSLGRRNCTWSQPKRRRD